VARVVLARRARDELLDLGWPLIDAVEKALAVLGRKPTAGCALRGRLQGVRSLRVGAYRILYQVIDDGGSVRVAAIRHRSPTYRTDPRRTLRS
jgi:mRNA-degrading endonuclease RelE of RelBE toxin-antitoxin system